MRKGNRGKKQRRRKALRKPIFSGSTNEVGGAYFFDFPFDIYVEKGISEIQDLTLYQHDTGEKTEVRLYPPYRNRATRLKQIEQLRVENMPYLPGTIRPDYNRVRLKKVSLNIPNPDRSIEYADALRIDLSPDRGSHLAEQILRQVLGLLRWWTKQWWIGRANLFLDYFLRNYFPINEKGERLAGIDSLAIIKAPYGWEMPLSLDIFRDIGINIKNGQVIPLSWDVYLDAVYFSSISDLRRSILDAAIACEAVMTETVQALIQRKKIDNKDAKIFFKQNSIIVKLKKELPKLIGHSFESDYPDSFLWINSLSTARGMVAHGKPLRASSSDQEHEVTDRTMDRVFAAVLNLFWWLEFFQQNKKGSPPQEAV